jgi:hypothetical protein
MFTKLNMDSGYKLDKYRSSTLKKVFSKLNYVFTGIFFLTHFFICLNFAVLDCRFCVNVFFLISHYSQGHHDVRDGVAEVRPQLHLPPQAGQSDRPPCPRYPTYPKMEFLNSVFSRGFPGTNSSLLILEFLSGFLPSFFLSTQCFS